MWVTAPYLGDGAFLERPRRQGQFRRVPQLLPWNFVDGAAGLLHRGHQALVGRLQLQGAQGIQGPALVGLGQVPWRRRRRRGALPLQQLGLTPQVVLLGLHVGARCPCGQQLGGTDPASSLPGCPRPEPLPGTWACCPSHPTALAQHKWQLLRVAAGHWRYGASPGSCPLLTGTGPARSRPSTLPGGAPPYHLSASHLPPFPPTLEHCASHPGSPASNAGGGTLRDGAAQVVLLFEVVRAVVLGWDGTAHETWQESTALWLS